MLSFAVNIVPTSDLPIVAAATAFIGLNRDEDISVSLDKDLGQNILVTSTNPAGMLFPEGWYVAKSCFRNKHHTAKRYYDEMYICKTPNIRTTWDETNNSGNARWVKGSEFTELQFAKTMAAMNPCFDAQINDGAVTLVRRSGQLIPSVVYCIGGWRLGQSAFLNKDDPSKSVAVRI
jgi:hypothetical protein